MLKLQNSRYDFFPELCNFFIEISLLEIKELVQCLDIIVINLEERVRNIR